MPEADDSFGPPTAGPVANVPVERWVFVGDETSTFLTEWLRPFLDGRSSRRIEGYVLDLANGGLSAALEAAELAQDARDEIMLTVADGDDARAAHALARLMKDCELTNGNNRLIRGFDVQRWPILERACSAVHSSRKAEPRPKDSRINERPSKRANRSSVLLGGLTPEPLGQAFTPHEPTTAIPVALATSSISSSEDYPYYPVHILVDGVRKGDGYSMRILPGSPIVHDAAEPWICPPSLESTSRELLDNLDTAIKEDEEDDAERQDIQRFGDAVDEALFSVPELKSCLEQNLTINKVRANAGLLIRLHFGKYAQRLSDVAWETWRHDVGGERLFLIDEEWISLVRFVPSEQGPLRYRKGSDQSLKLALVESSFEGPVSKQKDLEGCFESEKQSITSALRGLMTVKVLKNPTLEKLKTELKDTDICHFLGHGFDHYGKGFIVLADYFNESRGKRIYWSELRPAFSELNAPYLQLVNLSACSLQRAGFGTLMAKIGIPGVIAMQGPITTLSVAGGVFSQELYQRLAAGWHLHRAFSEARRAIRTRNNRVEGFMPVLIMSTDHDVVFKHPNLQKARALVQQSELEQDPLKSVLNEAGQLERRGELDAAVRRLENIPFAGPNNSEVTERVSDLRSRIETRKRIQSLSDHIQRALSTKDYPAFKNILSEIKPLAGKEPALTETLEIAFFALARELGQLRQAKEWLPARQVVQILDSISLLIPSRPEVRFRDEIENEATRQRAEQLRQLKELESKQRFDELADFAGRLVSLQPDDPDFREYLEKAQIARQIHVTSSADLRQQAERFKREHRWSDLKKVSREMRRLNPTDRQTAVLLQEALRGEAEALRRERRWDEAEANYAELLDLAASDEKSGVSELLAATRIDHASHAKRHRQWDVVATVARQVVADPAVSKPRRQEAQKMQEEADNAIQLLNRIKLL